MSFPSLTTSWTPASSCVASTAYWYAIYETIVLDETNILFSNMFGTPSVINLGQKSSPTGDCFPPSYTLSVPYLTAGDCPSHYYRACSTGTMYNGQTADYIMCCPSVEGWKFECPPATVNTRHPYGCQASFARGAVLSGSRTDLVARTAQADTHTIGGDNGVNAWGIALLSTPSRTSSSSIASSTSSTGPTSTSSVRDSSTAGPSSSQQGLSTGAAAGIGAGVGVAILIILGFFAFWVMRRRQKAKQRQQQQQQQQQQPPMAQHYHQYDGGAAAHSNYFYHDPSSQNISPGSEFGPRDTPSSQGRQSGLGPANYVPSYEVAT